MTTAWAQRRKDRIDDLAGGRSLTSEALRRLRRDPVAIVGGIIVGLFVLVAAFSPLLAPHGAAESFPELQAELRPGNIPGAQPGFPLGSDQLGRDFLSRMILASQQALLVGVLVNLLVDLSYAIIDPRVRLT